MSQKSRYNVHVDGRVRPLSIVADEYDTATDFTRFFLADRLVATVPTSRLIGVTEERIIVNPEEVDGLVDIDGAAARTLLGIPESEG